RLRRACVTLHAGLASSYAWVIMHAPGDIGLDAKGCRNGKINAPSSERSLQTGCADPTKSAADRQHQRCRTEAAGPAAPPLYQLSAGCEPSVGIRCKSCGSRQPAGLAGLVRAGKVLKATGTLGLLRFPCSTG